MRASIGRRSALAAAELAIGLPAAGCGGSDDETTTDTGASGVAGATGEAVPTAEQVPLDGPPPIRP